MYVRVLIFLLLSILAGGPAMAQSGTSAISGIVIDASNAAVPGATVSVTNENTGVAVETFTNEEGRYRVSALVPGIYRVAITLIGFDPVVRRPITLEVGQTLAVDATLDIAKQSEAVTVKANLPVIESQSSNVAQVVTREMLAALPLPNRAAASLAALAPGVIMIDTGSGTAENYPVFSVAGGRARNQNFILDGGNASNAVGLTRPQQLTSLPVDAMQEFRVITNNYAAEFGHSTGGVVTMSTRSGTNDFHGSVFESLRDDAFDARNFFATTKPPISLNQFGGTAGGPLKRSQTFFFGSWERTRQLTSDAVVSTVPTVANRLGDFSDLRTSAGHPILIFDPATGQPFPGNLIAAERIDPVARAALAYYPAPNRSSGINNAGNYVDSSSTSLDRDILVGRIDHQLRSTDFTTLRYYINNSNTETSGSYDNPVADPLADRTDVRVQSLTAAHTHMFRPQLVNELRVTYLRRKFIDQRPGLRSNLAGGIGLSGVSDRAFPVFTIPGYASLGGAAVSRFQTPITDRQVLESLSWFSGAHAFKLGAEFRAGSNDEIRDRGSSGVFTFSPVRTSNAGAPNTGNALASFLLGDVTSASVQQSDLIRTRAAYWALFVQDDWRVTDRLTLNYGIRWEAEVPRREIDNRMNGFDRAAINPVSGTPGVVTFAGRDGAPERAFATDLNNFGPRFGLAYRLDRAGRTVLRGGTGVFYGPTVSNTVGDAAALGFSTMASFVGEATGSVFRLRDGFPAFTRPELGPQLGAVPLGRKPNTAVSFFDPNQVAPTSYQWNVGLQHELVSGVVVEGGYVMNISRHLTANDFSVNQVPPELMGPGDAQQWRPFPQFSDVTTINPSIGRSSYYAGYVRVQKRAANGLSLLAHYTRSRFMDDVESANEYGNTGSYMDAYHRNLDWAASASDVPHHFVLTVLYEVPSLFGNRYASALPRDERTLGRWFNTAAFAAPAPFTFGNSPRSVLRGPGIATTDVTLEKSIAVTAGTRLNVRAEAYNVLNRTNFMIPGFTFGAPDFGLITSARPARTIQLAARLQF